MKKELTQHRPTQAILLPQCTAAAIVGWPFVATQTWAGWAPPLPHAQGEFPPTPSMTESQGLLSPMTVLWVIIVSVMVGCRSFTIRMQSAQLAQWAPPLERCAGQPQSSHQEGQSGDHPRHLELLVSLIMCACKSTRCHRGALQSTALKPEIRPGGCTHEQQEPSRLRVIQPRNPSEQNLVLLVLPLKIVAHKLKLADRHPQHPHALLIQRQLQVTSPHHCLTHLAILVSSSMPEGTTPPRFQTCVFPWCDWISAWLWSSCCKMAHTAPPFMSAHCMHIIQMREHPFVDQKLT